VRKAHFSPLRAKFQKPTKIPAMKRLTINPSVDPVVPDWRPIASTIWVVPRPKMKEKWVPLMVSTEFRIDRPPMARNHPAPFLTICSARSFCSMRDCD